MLLMGPVENGEPPWPRVFLLAFFLHRHGDVAFLADGTSTAANSRGGILSNSLPEL
jgi:hypothetical protein